MNFTKDQILILRHGLDTMCRAEANGVAQGGLDALEKTPMAGATIGARLSVAVEVGGMLKAEYERLDEEERAAAAAAEAAVVANAAEGE